MAGFFKVGTKKYHLDADEAERLMARESNMNVIKTLQSGLQEGQRRFGHFCYVKLVGFIANFTESESSNDTTSVLETSTSDTESTAKAQLSISDTAGLSLTNTELYEDCEELIESRAEYLVFEDDFTPRLAAIIKRNHGDYSFKYLYSICRRFDPKGIQQHERKAQVTYEYFTKQGLTKDEAKACAFAIAFYTGSQSETINQGTSLIVRTHYAEAALNSTNEKIGEDAAIIMFYLVRGLSYIKFYWGTVTRSVQLKKEELQDYKTGALITWIQFSSSMKGTSAPEDFQNRNTQFTIQSLTGRGIREFSNFPDEDEVLFLPHSSFLVHKVETIGDIHYISLKQIELGLCKYSVLWVDDQIFNEDWENKRHMEKASTAGVHINVHFIPKSNTETALAFLCSPFGKRLKQKETFRIVTDMNRYNESEPHNAGARLLANVRELGFNCDCLVFTSDTAKANKQLDQVFNGKEKLDRKIIKVTQSVADLETFVNFTELRPSPEPSSLCVVN